MPALPESQFGTPSITHSDGLSKSSFQPTIQNDNMASLSSSKPKRDEQLISQVCGSSRSRELKLCC